MRSWLPCAGFVVAGVGVAMPALVYGCAGFSAEPCSGNTCGGDASVGGDSPVGSEGSVTHDGGGDSAVTDGHPGDGPGISCDAATAIACNGTCVDKETDPANCGSCGHACGGPEAGMGTGVCAGGACQVACEAEAGTTLYCATTGTCVDPTGIANCGTCGNGCYGPEAGPGHPACQPGGMCAVACDSDGGDAGVPDILCSGSCVSPDDVNHCGTCTPCAQPPSGHGSPTCPAAQCVMTCLTGYHPSGASCNADCTLTAGDEPSTDPCVVADGWGIFVAEGSPTATANGTKEHPYATIVAAMDAAATGGKRVYACGTFTVQSAVGATEDGVTVYGGFDCATWTYNAGTRTKVAPTAAGFALTVNSLATGVTFEDFEFDSIAATTPGGSSQAVLVNGSQNVTFRRVTITAASASVMGLGGTAGTNSWSGVGTTGKSAGTPTPAFGGGTQSSCTCGGTGGQGGNGGTWDSTTFVVTQSGGNGSSGTVGPAGSGGGGAHQGASGPPSVVVCSMGSDGAAGAPGTGGAGGSGPGTLSATGWSNPAGVGAPGQPAGPAQGGQGGGGGLYDPAQAPSGASGAAGGGCGGCGGIGAASGGGPGGSSIALVVLSSTVTIDTASLTAAAGGAGGTGGAGQAGQSGGPPGTPAAGGCNGGSGGTGGTGGAGGGGAGGHSIAIAFHGTAPTQVGTVTTNFAATPAAGGMPGGGIAGTPSAAGLNVATQSF